MTHQASAPSPRRRSKATRPQGRARRIGHYLLSFVALLVMVDALVGERGLVAQLRAKHEYDELAATIAADRAENSRLREESRRLRTDPAAVEEIARRELGLIRPGEKVFIVKDVTPAPVPAPAPAVPREP